MQFKIDLSYEVVFFWKTSYETLNNLNFLHRYVLLVNFKLNLKYEGVESRRCLSYAVRPTRQFLLHRMMRKERLPRAG